VASCDKSLSYDYSCFLKDAKEAISLIRLYGRTSLGTMEGTNAKVYAARLKVWGCSWSRRGAIAMARIRAHIASGLELIFPVYCGWLTKEERERRDKHNIKSATDIPQATGEGWEPPSGKIILNAHLPGKYYGALYCP